MNYNNTPPIKRLYLNPYKIILRKKNRGRLRRFQQRKLPNPAEIVCRERAPTFRGKSRTGRRTIFESESGTLVSAFCAVIAFEIFYQGYDYSGRAVEYGGYHGVSGYGFA